MTASPVASSRLPVGSSARISPGRPASARPIATRCCCPPESCFRIAPQHVAEPEPRHQLRLPAGVEAPGEPRLEGEVPGDVEARDQVELLEHEPDRPPPQLRPHGVAGRGHHRPADADRPGVHRVEPGDQVQERALAAARLAGQRQAPPGRRARSETPRRTGQRALRRGVGLRDVLDVQHAIPGCHASPASSTPAPPGPARRIVAAAQAAISAPMPDDSTSPTDPRAAIRALTYADEAALVRVAGRAASRLAPRPRQAIVAAGRRAGRRGCATAPRRR